MRKTYQGKTSKSNANFEVVGKRELLVQVPLPMAEVWAELQAEVEELTGQAGLRIVGAILEDEVQRCRTGKRPDWGEVFASLTPEAGWPSHYAAGGWHGKVFAQTK